MAKDEIDYEFCKIKKFRDEIEWKRLKLDENKC